MRTHISRFLFALPLMILIGAASEARAQKRNHHSGYGYYGSGVSVGVGVGYGRGYGPYWGPGWGPGWGYGGWGVMPFDYGGFYGNGLSRYGPPVPTYKPIPGVFGKTTSSSSGGVHSRPASPVRCGWASRCRRARATRRG